MSPRNIWEKKEIKCMLDILKEKKILNMLEQKVLPVSDIYRGVEREMARRGFGKKNAKQIKNKWSQLKSTYICVKRNHNPDFYLTKDLEFREEVAQLVESQDNVTPADSISSSFYMESYFDKKSVRQRKSDTAGNSYKQGSYKKTFWKFMQHLKNTEKQIQDDFIKQQRIIMENERKLQVERDNQIIKLVTENTNLILKTSEFIKSGKYKPP